MPADANSLAIAARAGNLLLKAGLPIATLPCAVAQMCLETGWFSNPGYDTYNNYSGIKYTTTTDDNGNRVQKNAVPAGGNPDNGVYGKGGGDYAKFNTPLDWAIDLVRILNDDGAANISDPTEYATQLKSEGYFQGPLTTYAATLSSIIDNHLADILPTG